MLDLLYKLENERWDWTRRGIEEFRSGFLKLIDTKSQKARVMIGVYGPTQVGKTTLILRVLGIREEKIKPLSKALRGKRAIGNSATITGTFYQRSADESFKVIGTDGLKESFSSLEELEESMSRVRRAVEGSEEFSVKPLIIQVPLSYFNQEKIEKRLQDIEVLDLPGDDSREEAENVHVERCLSEYLPQCRVCILMEISSQLVNLTQIKREQVKYWMDTPQYFRVVLTRSVTDGSTRKSIKASDIKDKESFLQSFYRDFKNNLTEGAQRVKVYPIEIGDSLEDIKEYEPDLYNTASPWLKDILNDLIEDLSSAYTPENEVNQMKHLEQLLIKRKAEELDRYKEKLKLVNEEIKQNNLFIKAIWLRKKSCYETIMELTAGKAELVKAVLKKANVESLYIFNTEKYDRDDMLIKYYAAMDVIKLQYEAKVRKWNELLSPIFLELDISYSPLKLYFEEQSIILPKWFIFKRMNTKKYLEEDLGSCKDTLESCNEENFAFLTNQIIKQKKKLINDLNSQIKTKEYEIEKYEVSILDAEEKTKKLNEGLMKIEEQVSLTEKAWEVDKHRLEKLNLFLRKAFVEEAKHFESIIYSPKTTVEEKWLYHQYLNIITKDVERVTRDE